MRACGLSWILLLAAGVFTGSTAQAVVLGPADVTASTKFTQVTSVRELSDGTILVADRRENRLVHLDFGSGTVSDVGRPGRGPREFETIGPLAPLGADLTLFPDGRLARWNLVEGARMLDAVQHRSIVRLLGWRLNGGDEQGRLLGTVGFLYSSGQSRTPEAADSLYVVLADLHTDRADTIAKIKGAGQRGWIRLPARGTAPASIVAGNPLDTHEQPLLFRDGAVAIARLDPYRVDWRLPDGRWVNGTPLPFERQSVSDAVRCDAMIGQVPPTPRCDPDLLPGWPDEIPPFLRTLRIPMVHAAPHGMLVITRTYLRGASVRRYDIVDRAGRRVGILELPSEQQIVGFGEKSVYVVTTGEYGLQTLKRHPWSVAGNPGTR